MLVDNESSNSTFSLLETTCRGDTPAEWSHDSKHNPFRSQGGAPPEAREKIFLE
jgi:hypothetical protein